VANAANIWNRSDIAPKWGYKWFWNFYSCWILENANAITAQAKIV